MNMMKARNNVMGMGAMYGDLSGDSIGAPVVKSAPKEEEYDSEEEVKAEEPFEFIEDDDEEYDSEEECDWTEYAYISEAQKKTLQNHLMKKDTWTKMKGLGKGFENGAKFVPIAGDGNCFWNAVSTYLTANKNCPEGTSNQHN